MRVCVCVTSVCVCVRVHVCASVRMCAWVWVWVRVCCMCVQQTGARQDEARDNIPLIEDNIPLMEDKIPLMEDNIPLMESFAKAGDAPGGASRHSCVMSHNTALSTLWLSWNGVGDLSPPHAVQPDEDLSDVNKPTKTGKGNKASANSTQSNNALVETIARSHSLTDLDLSNCRFGADVGVGSSNWH